MYDKLKQVFINQDYSVADSTYCDSKKAVVFSPFTSEVVLCDIAVLEFLTSLEQASSFRLCDVDSRYMPFIDEILEKLISMRIILLKE